ncbi:MAG: ABC transporter substrate-binding protein [Pseudomonadota bacterium]
MKKFWLPLLFALGMGSAHAAVGPDTVVKEGTDKMRALIVANHQVYNADKPKFYAAVDEVLVPLFDVRYISQLVLGKSWKTATADQRTRFQRGFKSALIRNYADALLENYDSVEVSFQPVRVTPDATDATVKCTLTRKNGPPVQLAFAMREVDGAWKIYDTTIENLSLVTSIRSQYAVEVKKNGLEALIQRVEAGQIAADPGKGVK